MLPKADADKIFTTDLKSKLHIGFPLVRTYSYTDKSGKYYMVLTEKYDGNKNADTIHKAIKAYNFKATGATLEKQWEINDAAENTSNDNDGETSIWFWTKFCSFRDIDKDGLVDPIIVYGTPGSNSTDDGRVKILLHHKGNKIVIRHKNGVLDDERHTQVDAAFYSLPVIIQNEVTKLMKEIVEIGYAIFPNGWEKNMKNHKLRFDESK